MERTIKLNDFKYRYDVYQMCNIYFTLDELKFPEEEGEFEVNITSDKVTFKYNDIINEEYFSEEEKLKETIKKISREKYILGEL